MLPVISQRGADGTPIWDEQTAQLRKALGKNRVLCTVCASESGIRLCPNCHSRLPRSLDKESPMFGLVGVRNSGKTVFLSVLHKELVRQVGKRFNASIDTPGGAIGYARELEQNNRSMEGTAAELPGQTQARADKHVEPALYDWKYMKGDKQKSTVFSFYDSAGEDLVSVDRVETQQYLKSADGIILLLDPFAFPENIEDAQLKKAVVGDALQITRPEDVMSNLTEVIRSAHNIKNNKKIKVPIAVAVAKIDAFFDQVPEHSPVRRSSPVINAFDEQDSLDVHEHMIALVQKWGGDNLIRKMEQEFETWRFFGVSALGAEPDYATSQINERGVLPHRVVDPLLWLMANRGFIPTFTPGK